MVSALEALARLREGNLRFAAQVRGSDVFLSQARRAALVTEQQPFAIILGCSDSRVPAEIVFDQGLGDLFVIRVAGNIVAPSQVGSVEFAAARYDTRLVVVLGHSQCGAILATLEELRRPTENQSRNLRAIVDRVRPSVEGLLATDLRHDESALVRQAVRANIRASPTICATAPQAGAADPERWPAGRGRRVFAGDRRGGVLRRGNRRCLMTLIRQAILVLALGSAGLGTTAAQEQLGKISFPNSGSAEAQPQFIRGVLLLHNFHYDQAAEAFRQAQKADPAFALAYWGEALTYTHQVWNQQDLPAARAALARLAPTTAARLAKAPTPRERMYLASAERQCLETILPSYS